jgi:hypothetical protein
VCTVGIDQLQRTSGMHPQSTPLKLSMSTLGLDLFDGDLCSPLKTLNLYLLVFGTLRVCCFLVLRLGLCVRTILTDLKNGANRIYSACLSPESYIHPMTSRWPLPIRWNRYYSMDCFCSTESAFLADKYPSQSR